MNAIGIALVWTALQVTLFCLAGSLFYAAARWRHPALGAWAAGAVLVGAVGLSLVACSPWPACWSVDNGGELAEASATEVEPADEAFTPGMISGPIVRDGAFELPSDEGDSATKTSAPAAATSWNWLGIWSKVRREITPSSETLSAKSWHWSAWLGMVMLVAIAIGMVRLLVALAAARQIRSRARRLLDDGRQNAHLFDVLAEVQAELCCPVAIELREMESVCSASTMGWRRPAIMLPENWREWSEGELRAVLAHEVAHIARGDFAVWLLAQVGVVLHFYNPLVHWLAARLRLEQEMAADLCCAPCAGGRQSYLNTLAQMALRQNEAPAGWAARPFLPTRGTLMRRIEMLHRRRALAEVAVSPVRRWVLAGVLILVAAAIAGVRGPTEGRVALAAGEEELEAAKVSPAKSIPASISLNFVPEDSDCLFSARPAELVGLKSLGKIPNEYAKLPLFKAIDLPLENVAEITLSLAFPPNKPKHVLIVRSTKPHNWKKLRSLLAPEAKSIEVEGREVFRTNQPSVRSPMGLVEYRLADDRTIVFVTEGLTSLLFDLRPPTWTTEWNRAANDPVAMRVGSSMWKGMTDELLRRGKPGATVADLDGPGYFRGGQQGDIFQFRGEITCHTDAAAATSAETLLKLIPALEKNLQNKETGNNLIVPMILHFLHGARIDVAGRIVLTQAVADPVTLAEFARAAEPNRSQPATQLKRLSLALLYYLEKHKHFPAAIALGSDGKTPHSWRVDILPFLDDPRATVIHDRYKFDEPWNSEHNRGLIAEGAEYFSHPSDPTDCGFFLVTGPGTTFDVTKPPSSIRSVIDGTSKTISLVEAQRSIPWTKPEDCEVDADKPLPKLGGFSQDGFQVALLDGSVHLLPNDADEKMLKKLMTKAGREPDSIQDAIASGAKPAKTAPPDKPSAKPKSAASSSTSPDSPAARRAAAMNQVKHIALAMHIYHDKHGRFPTAVVMGPDGKTPHSWRVELLPYLGYPRGKEVYDRYKINEPWDSEHNQALIKEGAKWFGSPDESEKGNSAYFFVTGPGSMFDADSVPAIKTVSDGLSNTLGVVEAKRSIPWTKPEDIYIDPDKPLPELGGYFDGGFHAAIMDGSAHFLPADIDEAVFKKLVTKAGGEVVTIPHPDTSPPGGAGTSSVSKPRSSTDESATLTPAAAVDRTTASLEKLRRIERALASYCQRANHFPEAIVLGSDGKTPHSWRVEMLRSMPDNARALALYERYRMNEPWDSAHNLTLLKDGAEFFSEPGDDDSGNAAYFAVTGPGTLFDADARPSTVRSIADGPGNTLSIVEAKRSIPWTKPEDIRITPDQPLPKLGGFSEKSFLAAYASGGIRRMPSDIGEALLKKLVTKSGGEQINLGDGAGASGVLRDQSFSKLMALGVAFANYHDARKHFPSAVVLGADGKTTYSWRVEILRYLEPGLMSAADFELATAVYSRYKLDEPWDSPQNRELIKEGARLFSEPLMPSSEDCAYFLITGPGTAFDASQRPSTYRDITDGSNKTIGIVESKRAIPWTKPEDIEFDPAKPLPVLGGFSKQGFTALFMDGSAHFLPQDTDAEVLNALFTKSGREPLSRNVETDRWELK